MGLLCLCGELLLSHKIKQKEKNLLSPSMLFYLPEEKMSLLFANSYDFGQ